MENEIVELFKCFGFKDVRLIAGRVVQIVNITVNGGLTVFIDSKEMIVDVDLSSGDFPVCRKTIMSGQKYSDVGQLKELLMNNIYFTHYLSNNQ